VLKLSNAVVSNQLITMMAPYYLGASANLLGAGLNVLSPLLSLKLAAAAALTRKARSHHF
jgi:hypothetical protein